MSKSPDPEKVIVGNILIQDLITQFPDLIEVLLIEYGFYCVNCFLSHIETLEEGAAVHGIEGEEFQEMLRHLRDVASGKEKALESAIEQKEVTEAK